MPTKDYSKLLFEQLTDPEIAAEYLSTAIEGGEINEFLLALRNVAEAHGGVGVLANITDLNRQNKYKMLFKIVRYFVKESGNKKLRI